jgi:hypothetical protein
MSGGRACDEKEHWEDQRVDERIIIKVNHYEIQWSVWAGLVWLRI